MRQHCRWISPLLGGLLFAPASFAETTDSVVFVSPSSEQLDRSLRDALSAQLSGGPVTLVFEHFAETDAPLGRRMSEARAYAESHHARGVFWIEAQPDGDWLLYLTEPDGERTLVRRVEVEANGTDAAVEAVAVITRQSAEALLGAGGIGMRATSERVPASSAMQPAPTHEPGAKATSPPAARGHLMFRGLSFSAAYAGDLPASAIGWDSGLSVSVAYHVAPGLYGAAGYTFFRDSQLEASSIVLGITRNPIYVEGGYSFGHGPVVPSVGGRVIVELLGRHAVSTSGSFSGTPDSTRASVFLSPRARIDCAISPGLAVYGSVGADFGLNRFSFVSRANGMDRMLLEPNTVRPAVELGLSFWP